MTARAAPGERAAGALLAGLARFESTVAILAYIVVAGIIFGDVLARELFGKSIWGAQRLAVYATIVAGYCGFGLATAQGTHLRPRFADHWIPARWDAVMNRVADLVTAAALSSMACFAFVFFHESYSLDSKAPVLDWRVWPVQGVIPLAFGLSALRHAIFALYPAHRPVPAIAQE